MAVESSYDVVHWCGACTVVRTGVRESEVKVGVHQASYTSPLLFAEVMNVVPSEHEVGCPGNCCMQTTWFL